MKISEGFYYRNNDIVCSSQRPSIPTVWLIYFIRFHSPGLLFLRFALRDFRFPERCKWDRRSSGMLRSVDWSLLAKVSGQLIGPIFKGQAVQEEVSFASL